MSRTARPEPDSLGHRRLRVLHVYKTYYPDTLGGVEQVLFQLTRGLAAQGVDNRLFVMSPDAEPGVIERAEATVMRCRYLAQLASTPVSWSALAEFRAQLLWADVVHYQFPWPFADLLHFMAGTPRPSVVTYQSDVVRQTLLLGAYRPLMSRFLGSVDRVVATSPNYLATSPVLSTLARAVAVIPNGLDADRQPKASTDRVAYWRQRVGEGFFLFVGVLRYYKGLDTLLHAARNLQGSVVIAGAGPELKSLKAQLIKYRLTNVKLVGEVGDEDKAALFQLAQAFVFPSNLRSEAFGMSLVEAASYGLPMVTCEIGTGTTFVNLDGVTGWTVPPDNPGALLDAMLRLSANPSKAQEMGRFAQERYAKLFTADGMAARYLALYNEIVKIKGDGITSVGS